MNFKWKIIYEQGFSILVLFKHKTRGGNQHGDCEFYQTSIINSTWRNSFFLQPKSWCLPANKTYFTNKHCDFTNTMFDLTNINCDLNSVFLPRTVVTEPTNLGIQTTKTAVQLDGGFNLYHRVIGIIMSFAGLEKKHIWIKPPTKYSYKRSIDQV